MASPPPRRGKFTIDNRVKVMIAVARGASLRTAAEGADLNLRTLESWLQRGRAEDDGPHHEFARVIDGLREDKVVLEPMTDKRLREATSLAAAAGNVQAQRLYWEMLQADKATGKRAGDKTPSTLAHLDELAAARARRRPDGRDRPGGRSR